MTPASYLRITKQKTEVRSHGRQVLTPEIIIADPNLVGFFFFFFFVCVCVCFFLLLLLLEKPLASSIVFFLFFFLFFFWVEKDCIALN